MAKRKALRGSVVKGLIVRRETVLLVTVLQTISTSAALSPQLQCIDEVSSSVGRRKDL